MVPWVINLTPSIPVTERRERWSTRFRAPPRVRERGPDERASSREYTRYRFRLMSS